ncbi:integrin beta-PS-like [Varroa jacobsoni]|uniref:Integrin beta n=1 Tax=Varroa destructor TaxID=109461 RepID=A0A7M7KLM5_VARDE|nr:integrin beta-PS-like [Varroa destructor]XP_022690133.1 integrin beta-PS-like [Varroa jacobsoni]
MTPLQIIALIGILLPLTAYTDPRVDEAYVRCHHQQTCRDCLNAGPLCSWCYKKDYKGARCDLLFIHNEQCQDEHDNQKQDERTIIDDFPLTEPHVAVGSTDKIIQLKPQKIFVRLRPGVTHRVEVQYRQAEDYPVDLYYLMDLSNSMSDDKDKLALLGNSLGYEMNKITRNFRLGFGSFVDKVVMPFVSTVPEKLQRPCPQCVAPYGFRNHLPLTTDTNRFVTEVQAANVSGNLDAPEGGFDAIMQAVVCTNEIQWREKARRILLFSTDAGFHYAGDGKLGGIVTPNDGQCHLDSASREYTHSALLDYPSLSQINSKIQEHKVNIIFAVTEDQESIYAKLANMLEGCSHGKLANDSSNVVDLVKDQYHKISSHIELTSDVSEKDEYLSVTFESKCLNKEPEAVPHETNKCAGIKVGDQVQFDALIYLKKCPKNPNEWKRTIRISPVGINERLEIDLQMICQCACEAQQGKVNAEECNYVGTYVCGVCNCNDSYSGKNCECKDSEHPRVGDETCRAANETRICSGRGECQCGQCICNERESKTELVTGKYCQCDNFSCDRHNGKLCGGEDRGQCVCGVCQCHPGWDGADCSCAASDEGCLNSAGEECNGHGKCHCGKCICEPEYTGDKCQDCPTCPGKCDEFKDCVECQVFPENPGKRYEGKECQDVCTTFITFKSPQLDFDENLGDKLCVFRDAQDCKISFVYRETSDGGVRGYRVRAKEKECAEPVNILAIILGVILGIVLIGLALLLIWKLLTTIHDRREFAKFEKERTRAKWDTGENPIYKGAVTTFRNPTYGGGK